jgi:hypothetical protein
MLEKYATFVKVISYRMEKDNMVALQIFSFSF